MQPLRTFTVTLTHNGEQQRTDAHFATVEYSKLHLWIKPHWYLQRRCVGVWDWFSVKSVTSEVKAREMDWLKEANVKL